MKKEHLEIRCQLAYLRGMIEALDKTWGIVDPAQARELVRLISDKMTALQEYAVNRLPIN